MESKKSKRFCFLRGISFLIVIVIFGLYIILPVAMGVAAIVEYLQSQPEVEFIGGLGLSMGGEVLLGAASDLPEITAIVADGATRRCTEELFALPSERPLVRNFTARVMFSTVQILSGEKPPKPLLESMVEAVGPRADL